jgi:hypothetical protein
MAVIGPRWFLLAFKFEALKLPNEEREDLRLFWEPLKSLLDKLNVDNC